MTTTQEDWPLDQVANVAAISDVYVVEHHEPILLVTHYAHDHCWAFLSGRETSVENGRVIGMGCALAMDASLREIVDLPPGWSAERTSVGAAWVRERDDEL